MDLDECRQEEEEKILKAENTSNTWPISGGLVSIAYSVTWVGGILDDEHWNTHY